MARIEGSDIERIRSTVVELVERHHLPGIGVGVVSGEDLVYAEGFGYADIESGRKQDPDLRQRIGSITKTMLGLCTMALVDEGKLSLDDRIVERLPDITFHGPAETLSLRHLLTHTGGIGEAPTMADFMEPIEGVLWSDTADIPEVSDAYPDGITIEASPGTKWAYANHGFALIGEIVARIEGQPIAEVMRRRVFEPLGMADSDCLDQPNSGLTTGYHRAPNHHELDLLDLLGKDVPDETPADGYNIRGRYQWVRVPACGAVQSTIPDMARYASALLRNGKGIVRPETFESMTAAHWRPGERLMGLGLPFFLRRRFGRRTFGHTGGIVGGWNTALTVIPEDDLAVLVHLNLTFDMSSDIESHIVQAVLDAPAPAISPQPVDASILEAAVGVYEPQPGHLTNYRLTRATGRVQITAREGELALRTRRGPWPDGIRMTPADPAHPAFFALDTGALEPQYAALALGEDGKVTGIHFDRLFTGPYLVRNDGLEPWA